MATKETTLVTETADDGTEIVSEISSIITETQADGTETIAEITTTAGDEPGEIEGHITLTETAPDGTETITEITTSADGSVTVEEGDPSLEEVIEAMFDIEIGDDVADDAISTEQISVEAESDVTQTDVELETSNADFTVGSEMFAPEALPIETTETTDMSTPVDSAVGIADPTNSAATLSDTSLDAAAEAAATEESEQEAHTEAATEAQEAADEFIASGDYEAAAQAREVAENEAWEAGSDSVLSAYDSSDLAVAAGKQDDAEYYSAQEALHAQQGDYEAAREDASNAGYAISDADSSAGGADHSGQADAEKYEMDWAVHEEKQADYYAASAVDALEDGNLDAAEMYAGQADSHQASADHFGDLGEHGGDMAVYDASSEVAAGGGFESSYDSTAVDTGFDAGMDTTVDSGFDAGTDDI